MNKIKCIIVDDEEDICEILGIYLTNINAFDLSYANSGNEAIRLIENNKPDLIICDYKMSNGNGGDVYSHLLKNNINIKYVLCSSDKPTQHEIFNDTRYLFGSIQKPDLSKGLEFIFEKLQITSHQ